MAGFTIEHEVAYAQREEGAALGDWYLPEGAGPFPCLICVHGGAWKSGSKDRYRHIGRYLCARGVAVFAIDYRLVGDERNRYPAAVDDLAAAIRWVRHEAVKYRVDPHRLGLMGDSAGAHLSSLVALAGATPGEATTQHQSDGPPESDGELSVKLVVGVYGVYDLLAQWRHDQLERSLDSITPRLLGLTPMQSKWAYYRASPLTYTTLDNNQTKFLLVWGEADDIVDPKAQSIAFLSALKQANFFVRIVAVPGAPHAWIGDPIDEPSSFTGFVMPRLMRFLSEHL